MLQEQGHDYYGNATAGTVSTSVHDAINYRFPIELRELRTVDGTPVPKSRAVVRTDTGDPISVVSDKYRLIKHETFMDAIQPFVKELGQPEPRYHLQKGGAFFAVEYVFKDHTVDVGGKNRAALRILGHNAYIPGFMMNLRVATIVLECLNLGIFAEQNIFALSVAHRGKDVEIKLPSPETALTAFTSSARVFQKYSQIQIEEERGQQFFLEDDRVVNTLPDGLREDIAGRWSQGYEKGDRTVWDLLQHATYAITHLSPRLSYTGRLQRLQKTARLFNYAFAGY